MLASTKRRQQASTSASTNINKPPTIATFKSPYEPVLAKTSQTATSNPSGATSNQTHSSLKTRKGSSHAPAENDWCYHLNPNDIGHHFLGTSGHMGLEWNAAEKDTQCNDEEDIDDSQEDSSGYYSSYHSVDLISSSGVIYNICFSINTVVYVLIIND